MIKTQVQIPDRLTKGQTYSPRLWDESGRSVSTRLEASDSVLSPSKNPLSAKETFEVLMAYRLHPHWKRYGFPKNSRRLHDELWNPASTPGLARQRLVDARSAYCLLHQGVSHLATRNVEDYEGSGFERVGNPLLEN